MFKKTSGRLSRENRVIAGISCLIERKRIKRLHLYIKPPDGDVLVTAPLLCPNSEIEAFVESKAGWIRKHQERLRGRAPQARMALNYETGEVLFFWGKPYRLTVIEDPAAKRGKILLDPEPEFSIRNEDMERACSEAAAGQFKTAAGDECRKPSTERAAVLKVPAGSTFEQRERLVKKKYKELLEMEAERILDHWSERTGLRYSSWHSRYMKSRWGSLSVRDKRVCLNTRLAEKPEICLIYVALHEIAHVKEPNHGPRFKAILDEYMPDWRTAERILKDR